ncbi:MAG: hypothetical protein RR576_01270 [Oscillospiraceae bacterium]
MERKIIEAVNEMTVNEFKSIKQAQQQFSSREIFDLWLVYEGIGGYTNTIIDVLRELGFIESEGDLDV